MNNNQLNPLQILQMIRNGQNPQQIMLSYLEGTLGNTPMGANLLNLARNNQTEEIEKIARNICSQRGMDYDTEFSAFRNRLGL